MAPKPAALTDEQRASDYICAYGNCTNNNTFRMTAPRFPYAGLCEEHARLLGADKGAGVIIIGGDELRWIHRWARPDDA